MNFPLVILSLATDFLLAQQINNYPNLDSFLPDPVEAEIALRQELDMFAIDKGLIQSPEFNPQSLFEQSLEAANEVGPVTA